MDNLVPCMDRERRTCLLVARDHGRVKFIPFEVTGLGVQVVPEAKFDERYQPIVNYPPARAAQLYLGYSCDVGATKEVLDYLGRLVNVSEKEAIMATTKQTTKQGASKKTPAAPPPKTEKPVKAGRRVTDPVVKSTKPAVVTARPPSAASRFQELIMEGKLTDDKIFEKVQTEFGLDESKRGYVKWYRNHLKKQGKNPPEPKGAK